ncbi:Phosphate-specific transport system accessory protein PhoU [Sinobacterium norvegicum]|uniref:Phosphate-specific transport system accessory protein PhoU n=1 Tax=Sinobacterium norvegicum TaxID=1641715 RepID=A0ABM9AE62_9GAMM|nr:phosphate signaling complex protein PhoU [Sinobacterium norvegicum]CAH0991349.1 Phosphate-specific transport system accessory protein PhoU [Sinobacterium norvegicum]
MSLKNHIYSQYDEELMALNDDIYRMGVLVGKQLVAAVSALSTNDQALASKVRAAEREIDQLEIIVDDKCAHILAVRQPAARDLRLILSISRIARDLERAGDEANKIAKIVENLKSRNEVFADGRLKKMANDVNAQLERALSAFSNGDVGMAVDVIRSDKRIDQQYGKGIHDAMKMMSEDSDSIESVMEIIWTLRSIERVGDHALNVAEQAIYYKLGKDIRHVSVKSLLDDIAQS